LDLKALQTTLREFAAEREWQPFHTPKNLAMALMVEAAELAEIFQWMTPEQSQAARGDLVLQEQVADEVADVLLYLVQIADHTGIDLKRAVGRKLVKNSKKHPPLRPGLPGFRVGTAAAGDIETHVLVDWENVQPKDDDIRSLVPDVTDIWLFHGPNQKGVAAKHASFGEKATPGRSHARARTRWTSTSVLHGLHRCPPSRRTIRRRVQRQGLCAHAGTRRRVGVLGAAGRLRQGRCCRRGGVDQQCSQEGRAGQENRDQEGGGEEVAHPTSGEEGGRETAIGSSGEGPGKEGRCDKEDRVSRGGADRRVRCLDIGCGLCRPWKFSDRPEEGREPCCRQPQEDHQQAHQACAGGYHRRCWSVCRRTSCAFCAVALLASGKVVIDRAVLVCVAVGIAWRLLATVRLAFSVSGRTA
jgi:NTP pyrophosphatase (non-canonical NTP hydrolase)